MFRLVTQNILSSQLSAASFLPKCRREHCDPKFRMQLLLGRLEKEIRLASNYRPVVFCLQEVHVDQAQTLQEFFQAKGFGFHHAPYNHVLGVSVAYPLKEFTLVNPARTVKVFEEKVGGWGSKEGEDIMDEAWKVASRYRHNQFVCLELEFNRHRVNVGSVHLPCAYLSPAAMTVHSLIAFQYMQQLKHPFILAGDFNFKPNSPQYLLATTGKLPPQVVDLLDPSTHGKLSQPVSDLYAGDPFQFALDSVLCSALREFWGEEPPFTNYVYTSSGKRNFHATLDYIFYHPGSTSSQGTIGTSSPLKCVSAADLKRNCARVKKRGPSLPNEEEPSDHLLLHADFRLGDPIPVNVRDYLL
ncbi:hypothetical protein BASA81_001949 [Batrachochytrium salamandrivorans]|nr:hypothetical protein BASA81_001949 [Batrachochytrium salamandrivorans]